MLADKYPGYFQPKGITAIDPLHESSYAKGNFERINLTIAQRLHTLALQAVDI